jgi:folate-binding protein YgfZ
MTTTTSTMITQQVHAVRHGAGIWLREDATFVRITGSDASTWLHSQTSNDVEGLESGQGCHNAVLDRQGRLQGHFTLHRWEDEYWMLIENSQADHLLKQLDDHLFIEDVQVETTGNGLEQVAVQGPDALPALAALMDTDETIGSDLLPADWYGVHPVELEGLELLAFRVSLSGEDGYILIGEKGEGAQLIDTLTAGDKGFTSIDADAQEIVRIEAGLPAFGKDMDLESRIPETTLERTAVNYEKGCYIGQEVVARLRTYGSVKQALMGLELELDLTDGWETTDLLVEDKRIGRMTSWCYSPTLERPVALAYLDRDHRTPDMELDLPFGKATVRVLPLVESPTREDTALRLYHESLDLFQQDLEDTDASAIPLLKKAILLHPAFEDAYEVLGVILHRHHRIDEAIYYMKHLVELNKNCLMAHTNLSVFYLAKGMIEEAEQEKALSAVLGMKQATDEREAKELAEQERQKIKQEAGERIGMFKEVLEIDPDDPVATFGLGKAYVQLLQYEEAIPYLRHATEVQKDFSAAYLDLGKCLEFLGKTGEALEQYQTGIAIASRKGDLMPMREMERRSKNLEEQTT